MTPTRITRRQFAAATTISVAGALSRRRALAEPVSGFRLNYILASPMYGTTPLAEVLPEVKNDRRNAPRHLAAAAR